MPESRFLPLEVIPATLVPSGRAERLERAYAMRRILCAQMISPALHAVLAGLLSMLLCDFAKQSWSDPVISWGDILLPIGAAIIALAAPCFAHEAFVHSVAARNLTPDPRLVRAAQAERQLQRLVLEMDERAAAWNEAARQAEAHGVDERFLRGLAAQRLTLERQRARLIDVLSGDWTRALAPASGG